MSRFSNQHIGRNHLSRRVLSSALVGLLGLFFVAGCGGSKDPFSYVKVKGTATYADGSLIPAARVKLIFNSETPPIDPKTFARPGVAEVNVADGTFDTETTHLAGDGLVPGKHKVQVMTFDKNDRPISLVPPEYQDPKKTPIEIDTAQGDLKILVKKPAPGAAGPATMTPGVPGGMRRPGNP